MSLAEKRAEQEAHSSLRRGTHTDQQVHTSVVTQFLNEKFLGSHKTMDSYATDAKTWKKFKTSDFKQRNKDRGK